MIHVQLTKLCTNSVRCNVPIVRTVAIISNAVARWRAMHAVVCKTIVTFTKHKIRRGVLETLVLVSTRLETRFYKSWSRSWYWDLGPWRLGLCYSWSVKLRQNRQDAQLSQRDRAAGCVIVFAKSRRLELEDNILWTLYVYLATTVI